MTDLSDYITKYNTRREQLEDACKNIKLAEEALNVAQKKYDCCMVGVEKCDTNTCSTQLADLQAAITALSSAKKAFYLTRGQFNTDQKALQAALKSEVSNLEDLSFLGACVDLYCAHVTCDNCNSHNKK